MAKGRRSSSSGGMGKIITPLVAYMITAIIAIVFYTKIFLNQSLFNTTVGAPEYSITSVVVPMVGIAISVGLVIGAVFLIVHFVKGSTSSGR